MQAKKLNIEPAYLPVAAGNLLNCNVSSLAGPVGFTMTQPYILITHIRLMNSDSAAHVCSLYKGATSGSAGGTQFAFAGVSVPPNSWVDWYGEARFDAADFLSGIADLGSKVIIEIDAEIGLA